jgi:hypothetical protein
MLDVQVSMFLNNFVGFWQLLRRSSWPCHGNFEMGIRSHFQSIQSAFVRRSGQVSAQHLNSDNTLHLQDPAFLRDCTSMGRVVLPLTYWGCENFRPVLTAIEHEKKIKKTSRVLGWIIKFQDAWSYRKNNSMLVAGWCGNPRLSDS